MERLPIERLLDELAGPIMSWRMASGELRDITVVSDPESARYKSASLRRDRALEKAERIIGEYRAN
jgi:hypothetical protein